MNYYSKGSYLIVGFDEIGNCKEWRQSRGTGIIITKGITTRKDKDGSGFDPTGLGRWSWVRIEGKANDLTPFISGYRPCKNRNDLNSVWN